MTVRDKFEGTANASAALAVVLERDLLSHYGPMIGQDELRQVLGYATMDAFRQALSRRQLPVPVFALPNRRGKYALAKDVAIWLASMRRSALLPARKASKK
jgi:hypothetical protein